MTATTRTESDLLDVTDRDVTASTHVGRNSGHEQRSHHVIRDVHVQSCRTRGSRRAGLAFIAWGVVDGILALVLVGLVPLAAGVFNVCLLGPLFKAPFSGKTLHSRP